MLSKKALYAFRALTYLDKESERGPILIAEISEKNNISLKFLEQILLEMKKGGILGSKKGKGGGYYLIHEAHEIPLVKVMRLMDGPIALLPCVSLNYYEKCADCDEVKCGINRVMKEVRDANLKILENRTLLDIRKQ